METAKLSAPIATEPRARTDAGHRHPPSPVRTALGEVAWASLPAAVQRRFTGPRFPRARERFRGVMDVVHASLVGRALAFALVLAGTPLVPFVGTNVPVEVTVDHGDDGSARWTRCYAFGARPRIRVASVKRLAADGSLVEALPGGLRMRLRVSAHNGSLHFDSTGYHLEWLGVRLNLPAWLSPGHTRVLHTPAGAERFRFTLTVQHPLFGQIVHQDGYFQELSG